MEDHPPIHEPKGVSYWDKSLQEYILDPTPDMHLEPPVDIKKGWRPTILPDPLAHLKQEGKRNVS